MDTLKDACRMKDPKSIKTIKQNIFEAQLSKAPKGKLSTSELIIQMKLERVFIDVFRTKTNDSLKSKFTTTNKKLQKRKMKKLKEQEMQQEKDREALEVKKVEGQITQVSPSAVDMLLGLEKPTEKTETQTPSKSKQDFTDIKEGKKKNKKKNKNKDNASSPAKVV